jgi:predicted GH43/DUF377 family glycosyl hydrolase
MSTPLTTPTGINLHPDNSRVLVRAFIPRDIVAVLRIIHRALDLSEEEVVSRLTILRTNFGERHYRIEAIWQQNFHLVRSHIPHESNLSQDRILYIGALFSGEYALESAALFNPSIIPHPDQTALPPGALRFIMSLRATGEGHISSIAFRSGIITAENSIGIEPRSSRVSAPVLHPEPSIRSSAFFRKLAEMEVDSPWSASLRQSLGDRFTRKELTAAIATATGITRSSSRETKRALECVRWLADANYEVSFDPSTLISERVIFPVSPHESNGMEDARFVLFTEDNGTTTYYATYTAYNGRTILSQLLETQDFLSFHSTSLKGAAVRNKGMALFPRRIDGKYVMISRQDDENLFLMRSENLHLWEEAVLLSHPTESWEAVKIGNCGSPIETPQGWLLITHGVGAMRRYCIGAMLLDLKDPSIVIGHLKQPLIEPDEPLRNGYVPNVVYTCGALIHGEKLILPYGLSDTSIAITIVDLTQLFSLLMPQHEPCRGKSPDHHVD